MKPLIVMLGLFTLAIVSCKKEINIKNDFPGYLKNVKIALKDSLSANDYGDLDFNKAILSKTDSVQLYFLRIPLKGKNIKNDFVLVKTNADGKVERGKIIHIDGKEMEYGNGKVKERRFDGNITISSLNKTTQLNSAIDNGYISALHPQMNLRTSTEEPIYPAGTVLPEVIVYTYINNGGISFSDWFLLQTMFYDYGGGGSMGGYYGSLDGNGGGGYSGGDDYGGGGILPPDGGIPVVIDDLIKVDFENQYANPAIDLEKYMNCFSNIPDAGATGSIEIFADIPVNSDPSEFFDWSNGSPGHTFIQLRKQNGSQSVCQNIGFYPKTGWKTTLTPAPIEGKWVDNQGHEMNASFKINLTAAQVQSAVTRILYLSRFVNYDIDDYNCTDWALDVFNETVGVNQRLDIPRYNIPGGMAPNGTSTPNGLYIKLQQMQAAGGSQAAGISISLIGWVGGSNGPCN